MEDNLSITPVGILPFDINEGYFFLSDGHARAVRVYKYQLTVYERPDDRYRALRSQFVNEWSRNLVNTYRSIKSELLRSWKSMNIPAVYSIETNLTFPVDETLLPVAKRSLVRHLSAD